MIKNQIKNTVLEYIWIGGKNEIRSKTKILPFFLPPNIQSQNIPNWNYDGSSTWQADSNGDTEITLIPCAVFKDPLRDILDTVCYLVLCETYNSNGEPTNTNTRFNAAQIFEIFNEQDTWFGLEQEYFIFGRGDRFNKDDGFHYCGTSQNNIERQIAEKHFRKCIHAGVKIAGINAEVCKGQWEFQIGICRGIEAADHLIIARYLLERIAEHFDAEICYEPKPRPDINGSGCHINFSTCKTRQKNGIEFIYKYIEKLNNKHLEHIAVYGENNHLRLTGFHETSSMDNFSWGIGTRNTSIRIPNQTFTDKCGYIEDRRPAANIDPYLAISIICETCCE